MRKSTMFISGILLSVALSAQTLPKGMTDLTAEIAANDPDFHLTTQDDRPCPKTSVLTINQSETKMFFTANSGAAGNELWVTDGTAAGTQMVKDINAGTGSSNPTLLTMIGDIVYFTADDGTHGVELWSSDGTSGNTKLVADIYGGSKSSTPMLLTNFNGKLLFWAQDVVSAADNAFYMYLYDPATGNAPTMISKTQGWNSGDSNYGNIVVFAKKGLAFFVSDPSTSSTGQEVWVTNGTSAGTKLLKDVWPGAGSSSLQWLTNCNDSAVVWRENTPIVYAGADSVNYNTTLGAQLWVSDGTSAGTHLLSFYDKVAGTDGKGSDTQFAWAEYFSQVNGLLFRADDGVHGVELGISNGKDTAGTHMLADINEGSGASWPEDYAIYHGYVCFDAASNVYGAQPSYWDPADQTVKIMSNVYPGGWAWCRYLTTVQVAGKDSFLYSVGANATSGSELFVSNGIGNVADLVVDMGPGDSHPNNLRNWKDALYLTYTSFPHLYRVVYTPKAAINPLTALTFDDTNWNDTLTFVIEKKHPELFTNKKIKAEILGTDNSFRISNTKNGTYGFTCKSAGNDVIDTMYVVAGKYLDPDSFVHNVKLRLTAIGIDSLTLYITSIVSPSFRYEKLYHVVCGNETASLTGVSLGENNSAFDQLYGADPVTGKNWGYISSEWSMSGSTQWAGEREIHDKAFGPGKGMIYKFQVDNGDYMVWVGFHEFWGQRVEKLKITGVDTINLTTPTSYEWYKNEVSVTGGQIEVDVQCAADNGYMNNILIGKIGTATCYDDLCAYRDSLYKSTLTSATKISVNNNLVLYPNPSTGIFNLKADPGNFKSYEVVDITGRQILRGSITENNTTINLSDKNCGIYIIKAYIDQNNISYQRVIIQR
jgi:ELWxxDGT repeat protein